MKGKSKGWGKEKIISAIVACAVILTLSAGVYSVVKESRRANDNKNNVVDLNERTQNNVAIRTEDGGVEPENTDSSDSKEDAADRKSTRLNSSHTQKSRMPSSA